jgi:hypothetical protein
MYNPFEVFISSQTTYFYFIFQNSNVQVISQLQFLMKGKSCKMYNIMASTKSVFLFQLEGGGAAA